MNNGSPSITIQSIKLKGKEDEIKFNADDIVLLVGANNVGKSRILKDLQEDIIDDNGSKVIIDEIIYEQKGFTEEQIRGYFERNISKDSTGSYSVPVKANNTYCYSNYDFESLPLDAKSFYKALFTYLSTESRLNMTRPIRFNGEIDSYALNIMRKLQDCSEAVEELNKALAAGFNKAVDVYTYFENDNAVAEYRIASNQEIAEARSSNKPEWDKRLKNIDNLQSQGDGIRSAVAILASLMVAEHSLFIIDEPEAFLHPPQAKMIGNDVVAMSEGKQCFIATHNIDFIKGVIEANSSRVKIIKIDRVGDKGSFNLISNESIAEIASDKNLKYTNILDGLFYDEIVLCEDETDCKFYSAILESINLAKYQRALFCAVGGKDQMKKVIPLLKRLSIRFSAIADIDLINSADSLRQLLNAIETDGYRNIEGVHKSFLETFEKESCRQVKTQQDIKDEINGCFTNDPYMKPEALKRIREILKNATSLDLLKKGGRRILPQGNCVTWFNEIKEYLSEFGIFIVECGEIERFVPDVAGHGNKWLENAFKRHSNIEDDEIYSEAKAFIERVFCERRRGALTQ